MIQRGKYMSISYTKILLTGILTSKHTGTISIHGGASDKISMYKARFDLLRQRLFRDLEFFHDSELRITLGN